MSKDETTQPSQRMKLALASGPNPPWTSAYFTCSCSAEYQLCASDECKEFPTPGELNCRRFETPPCWTCGTVTIIHFPLDTEPEGNPS